MKRVGIPDNPIPPGWQQKVTVKNFKENADQTVTVLAEVKVTSPSGEVFSSGFQTVRCKKVKAG
jgi:indole-3-glycerol phosphate synthase